MKLTQALLIALTTYSVGVSAQFGGFGGGNGGQGGNNGGQGGQGGQGGNNGGQGGQGGNNGGQDNGQNNGGQDNGQNNGGNNGQDNNGGNNGGNNNNNGGNNGGATLDQNNIQQASQDTGGADAEAGQADSATDDFNFINFCSGKTLTNGQQVQGGSCNGIVMGDIPGTGNMVSSLFQNPQQNDDIDADQTFDIQVQVDNLDAGAFTNPDTTYYSAPQALGNGGNIVGHAHISCQVMNGNNPPNAQEFAFFKGINDAGNGQGLLSATVDGGLAAGAYRCCTINSAANHQPVVMPVAQRGPQDDCVQFTVGQGNGNNGGNNNNNNNNNGQNNNGQGQDNNGQGQDNNGQGQDGQNQGQNGQNQGQGQGQDGQNQGQGQGQDGQNGGQGQGQGQDGQNGGQGQGQGGQGGQGGNGGGFGGFGGRRNRGRFMARDYVA